MVNQKRISFETGYSARHSFDIEYLVFSFWSANIYNVITCRKRMNNGGGNKLGHRKWEGKGIEYIKKQ